MAPETSIVRIRDRNELGAHLAAWNALAREAAEPNPFHESWHLLPAIEHFGGTDDIEFVLVYEGPRLIGLFPVHRRTTFRGLPLRSASLWQHEHCYLGTPLVHRDRVAPCMNAFLAHIDADRSLPRLWTWNWIGSEGPIYRALTAAAEARGATRDAHPFSRAIFTRRRETAERHMSEAISGKHRREFGRLEKRLHDMGTHVYEFLPKDAPAAELDRWIAEFIEIEGSGWKAEQKTAIRCNPKDEAFFRACIHGAHQRGQLAFLACRLDGKAVAMKTEFISADAGFSFKIAYDEAMKKYCPGILLQIWHTGELFTGPVTWIDSCASSNQTMIDRIWPDSRALANLTLAHRAVPEGLAVALIPWAKRIREKIRAKRAPVLAQGRPDA